MKLSPKRLGAGVALSLVVALATQTHAADDAVKQKADKLLKAAAVDAADAKAAPAKTILSDWIVAMNEWHTAHDKEIASLWSQWSKARSGDAKDEFPAEVIAYKIDAVYDDLRPAYKAFIDKLSATLSTDQVDAIKEHWSRSPGNQRTYEAYLQIDPELTDAQKQVIRDRLLRAREDAMLTDSDKEIVNIYKRHKLKVEQFIGALEWQKLHKAFAEKGKAPTTPKAD